jgi:hypothetical protein
MLVEVTSTLAVELPMANALVLIRTLAPTTIFAVAFTDVATTFPTNAVLLADTATVELPTVRLVFVVMTLVEMLAEAVITVAATLPVCTPIVLPENAVLLVDTATVELPMNTVLLLTRTLAPTVTFAVALIVVATTLPV